MISADAPVIVRIWRVARAEGQQPLRLPAAAVEAATIEVATRADDARPEVPGVLGAVSIAAGWSAHESAASLAKYPSV